ncbi:MAG: RNA-binding protein, partial [Victivallales bacterium]|nr:RNA-binding protein [Victivallales bacterium]MBR6323970.1 RNA-binding protein [Victivallales bacterium]
MAKNLYVGNLSYSVNDEILNELFSQYGKVDSARAITDRETGR